MVMKPFDYYKPTDIVGVLKLLHEHGADAKILAGGTDLLVQMKKERLSPGTVVSLSALDQLRGVRPLPGGGLEIGALTTADELQRDSQIQSHCPVLAEAASVLGYPEIRRRATIGGNVANASPAGDLSTALLTLDAFVVARNLDVGREIPLTGFFSGPGRTILLPGETIIALRVPPNPGRKCGVYRKLGMRRAMEIGIVCLSVLAVGETADRKRSVHIALGAVAPTPIRAKAAEALLYGREITPELSREAGCLAAEEASPITDVRGSDWYRKRMVSVLVSEALQEISRRIVY
jgi:aerobic carbon-monoxide dehydrogenase medium subunit